MNRQMQGFRVLSVYCGVIAFFCLLPTGLAAQDRPGGADNPDGMKAERAPGEIVKLPDAPSSEAVRIAKRNNCPLDLRTFRERYASDKDRVLVKVRFTGQRPVRMLADALERLSLCAPDTLSPVALDVDWNDVHTEAAKWNVLPEEQQKGQYKALETAIKRLTTETIGVGAKRDGKWVFPKADVKAVSERLIKVYVPTKKSPPPEPLPDWLQVAEEPEEKALRSICRLMGKAEDCIYQVDMFRNTVSFFQDGRETELPTDYFVFVPQNEYELVLNVPVAFSDNLGSDIVKTILSGQRNPLDQAHYFLQSPEGRYLPAGANNSSHSSPQGGTEVSAKGADDKTQWRQLQRMIGHDVKLPEDAPIKVLVGEPTFGSGVKELTDLGHEMAIAATALDSPQPLIEPVYGPADIGHAYHVAHLIGAMGSVAGWTGLGKGSDVLVANETPFMDALGREVSRAVKAGVRRIDFKPEYSIFNLSYMPGTCAADRPRGPSQNEREKIKRLHADVDRATIYQSPLFFVIAAAKEDQNCRYDNINPRHLTDRTCYDWLACAGRHPNAITVAGVDASGTKVIGGARLFDLKTRDKLIGAPGLRILSADLAGAVKGYSYRSGSSHATAIVTSLAARLAARYPELKSRHRLKPHLVSTATTPSSPELDKNLYGVVHFKRALESPPGKVTVWFEDGGGGTAVSGDDLVFLNPAAKLISIPYGDYDPSQEMLGGPVPFERLYAIVRSRLTSDDGIMFRNVYRPPTAERVLVGEPYQLDQDRGGKPICALDGYSGVPCLSLDGEPLNLELVTHIVMKAK